MTTSPDWRFVLSNPAHFLAFGFGAGLAKVAPGTWGTLVAIPLYLVLAPLPWLAYLALVAAMFLAGIRICGVTGKALGIHDYGGIVWDEIVAMLLILAFTPAGWGWMAAAFLLFRLFDIWKPFPIRWFDRSVHGGFGVMLDDLLAAVYALIALRGLVWLTMH
ncbi:phosphatidylglycerophosphatase A [Novimethylophilus kurashikiensis]|uniref:Phosphatidylglycerophosphatase A n=1 Tax=Novimethylophilus kurashikiensis TaxID=1825523 RepID=A0A2R5FC11_9PROT|nr:phosphatidylglycerophosphatase A [Novimethylophilus kurashikiensis]GBG14174.1 phosphatidylglycerophosphatase A [Novimethylophilus kurashikiensis]